MLIFGVVWIRNIRVDYNYQKWLGPDWDVKKAKFDGAGTYISNHQSFADCPIQCCLKERSPGFLSKEEFRHIPFIGFMAEVCQ